MTEEINFSYEGGLYGELIRNRTFKASTNQVRFWKTVGDAEMSLDTGTPLNDALNVSLKLDAAKATKNSPAGIANGGTGASPFNPGPLSGLVLCQGGQWFQRFAHRRDCECGRKNQFCQRESFRPDRRLEKI